MVTLTCVTPLCFFFQAEDGIRDLVRSRGLGDVYKRQLVVRTVEIGDPGPLLALLPPSDEPGDALSWVRRGCLLYTSDAADERSSVDLGGRRIIKNNNTTVVRTLQRKRENTI